MIRTEVLRELTERLGSSAEARWLAEQAPDRALLEGLVSRRLAGEPLQYLLGSWDFRGLELIVDPRALIPRPETEQVVEVARAELAALTGRRADPVLVDLGTGSGAIALALAAEEGGLRSGLTVWATDCNQATLELAAVNRDRVGVLYPWVVGTVRLARGDWFQALEHPLRGRIDLVVANPPYVDPSEWDGLQPELHHEPRTALLAGPGSDGTPGMAAVEHLVRTAPEWLARPGVLVVELAPEQAGPAGTLAHRLGYRGVAIRPDLAGRPRVLVAGTA